MSAMAAAQTCTVAFALASLHLHHHRSSCILLPRHSSTSLLGSSSLALRKLCPPAPSSSRVTAWFKFGTDSEKAGIYGSQGRDDFDRDDVEQYFNYMGMLATEGTYDKMDALLTKGIHPVDILLLLAASEGDKPKIQELMKAGAKYDVTDVEGRTALDRAQDDGIRNFILSFSK